MSVLRKLNGRHKLYKDLRMTYAWRYTDYGKNAKEIQAIEKFLHDRYGDQEWGWKYNGRNTFHPPKQWATYWSDPKRDRPRIYWIGVKDPEIMMVAAMAGLPT
jgi:hypothetical protein